MTRMTWLLVRLRWQLVVNHLSAGARFDAMERASRMGTLVVPALLILTLGAAATLVGLAGFAFGWKIGMRSTPSVHILLAVRVVLATGCLTVIVTSLMSMAESLTLHPRLLLLPIPRAMRHRLDVLAGALADPVILTAAPGLVLAAVGLTISGRVAAGAVALAAALALLVMLASLRSVVVLSIGRLVRRRRSAELFALVCVMILSLGTALPLLFTDAIRDTSRSSIGDIAARLPSWTGWVPTELYATSITQALAGDLAGGMAALLGLTVEALTLFVLSSHMYGWSLESASAPRSANKPTGRVRSLPRLYPLAETTSAIAVVQMRTALRSVRGRLIVMLPGATMALLAAVARRIPDEFPGGRLLASSPDAALAFGLAFSLYALLAFTMNQLAADREGLARQFLLPISDEDLLLGKALGCGLVFLVQATMCFLCLGIVLLETPPLSSLTVVLTSLTSYLLMAPAAAIVSALLPVRADLSKTGTAGNPHGLAMLGGTVSIGLLTVIGWHMVAAARGSGEWRALVTASAVAVAAFGISRALLSMSSPLISRRRENILLVADGH